jgi:hypothetical protein
VTLIGYIFWLAEKNRRWCGCDVDAALSFLSASLSPKSVKILQSSQAKWYKGRIDFITLLQSCPRVKNSFGEALTLCADQSYIPLYLKKEFRSHIIKFTRKPKFTWDKKISTSMRQQLIAFIGASNI